MTYLDHLWSLWQCGCKSRQDLLKPGMPQWHDRGYKSCYVSGRSSPSTKKGVISFFSISHFTGEWSKDVLTIWGLKELPDATLSVLSLPSFFLFLPYFWFCAIFCCGFWALSRKKQPRRVKFLMDIIISVLSNLSVLKTILPWKKVLLFIRAVADIYENDNKFYEC